MLSYNEQFQIALELAVEKHKNQTDKAGNPYILHPLHVMENVNSKEGKIVAILHDIIEDTDITEENRKVKCDVAFVPVGGTYTMSFEEAAQLINEIKPQVAVPIHYGSVVGTKQDAIDFIKLLNPTINGVILMK